MGNIKETASRNYAEYKEDFQLNKKYGFKRENHESVFITEEDREKFNDIANKTKNYIWKEIQAMLASVIDRDVAATMLNALGKAPARRKKDELLEVYYDVALQISVEDASNANTVQNDQIEGDFN